MTYYPAPGPGFNGISPHMIPPYNGGYEDNWYIPGNPHELEEVYAARVDELHARFEGAARATTANNDPRRSSDQVLDAVYDVYDEIESLRAEAQLQDRSGDDGAVSGALHERRWVAGPLLMDVGDASGRVTRIATWFDSREQFQGGPNIVYAMGHEAGSTVRVLSAFEASLVKSLLVHQMTRLFDGKNHDLLTRRLLIDGQPSYVFGKKAPVAVRDTSEPGEPGAAVEERGVGVRHATSDDDLEGTTQDTGYYEPPQMLSY